VEEIVLLFKCPFVIIYQCIMMEQAAKFHHVTVERKVKNSGVRKMRHMILELVRRPLLLPALTCIVEIEPRILELII
jgi:hypothetical protein